MFVQVIKGKVSDSSAIRAALDKWLSELAPGATGWLGSTTGVTDDGTLIGIVRFDSLESAQSNSDRPEQGRWWAETERLFDGEVAFEDSNDVDEYVTGDWDRAGFVQVMQGQVSDLDRARTVMQRRPDNFEQIRPDIAGHAGSGASGRALDQRHLLHFGSRGPTAGKSGSAAGVRGDDGRDGLNQRQ